jgi:hypothetical protein
MEEIQSFFHGSDEDQAGRGSAPVLNERRSGGSETHYPFGPRQS